MIWNTSYKPKNVISELIFWFINKFLPSNIFDGFIIILVSLSQLKSLNWSQSVIIAIANDYGKIQLYKSPCLENVIMDAYRGHSVHVTNVKFTSDGKKMLSIGGLDRCIMQWNIRSDNK